MNKIKFSKITEMTCTIEEEKITHLNHVKKLDSFYLDLSFNPLRTRSTFKFRKI